ncbi:MAG: hypothetical protein VX970_07500 [Planctomycetota bacterium]|nr:hypothetical protein [Planctomycetota bacterium]
MQDNTKQDTPTEGIEMPRPTAAPIVISFGAMCMASGLVLNWMFSVVGLILFFAGLIRWIYILATGTGEELLPLGARPQPVRQSKVQVEPLRPGMPGHRMRIPDKVHPVSSGLRGGAIGGVAMAVTALSYGLLSGRGIWYPVNLLGGMIIPSIGTWTDERLGQFHLLSLFLGTIIFVLTSLGVGLMFGILLPTMPRVPILWGGIVAPLLWTGAIYGFMGILNPPLSEHVDWTWFFASQFAYGITVGIVVIRSEKIPVGGFQS